jgi:alpha-galactosidase
MFRMSHSKLFFALFLALALSAPILSHTQTLAPTPPMGWNSWDAYGFTIDEADFKANATVLAGVKQYGWHYAVIDEGWYMRNTAGKTLAEKQYLWDENGLLAPDPARFPDAVNGQGLKPLADWVHAQGLKFGIHILRGIPRDVVKANLPIEGTSFHAADAADTTDPCPWDDGNWGIKDNAAGQAYYDSQLKLYAKWGLDFLKVDCISDHPYRPIEIRQIATAIRKTGRPIVLSLSPGPTSLTHAAEVGQYAQMWRISDDHWDVWSAKHAPGQSEFPFGVKEAFDRLASWNAHVKPGNWPDMDMLPVGWLGPHPGLGQARQTRETHDEQQTEFTLWAIARSPLILGANLIKLDDFTRSLITNQAIIDMNQKTNSSHPLDQATLPAGFENARVWRATVGSPGARNYTEFFAFFNLDDNPVTLKATWKQLGISGKRLKVKNVWSDSAFHDSKEVSITLPAHGSTVFQLK